MTRTEIEALEGRALDAAVAVALFGWQGCRNAGHPDAARVGGWAIPPTTTPLPKGATVCPTPHYHEDWSTIPLIVKAMERYTCDFTLQKGGDWWYADFLCAPFCGDSAPTAVCRAALLALSEVNDDAD